MDFSVDPDALGFTGSRDGMTDGQFAAASSFICLYSKLHHGDCLGADAIAHGIATDLGVHTVAHPPSKPDLRAYCKADVVLPAYDYLTRDRHIVDSTAVLIGTPSSEVELFKGGTWYTLHYAEKIGKPLFILWPDGSIESRN